MRDITEVIDRIRAVVAGNSLEYAELIQDLDNLKQRAFYMAPELHRSLWVSLSRILAEHLGDPTEASELVQKIARIFGGHE